MTYNDLQEAKAFDRNIEFMIPVLKYFKLCNCVYCWIYSKTKFCDECEKLFCLDHRKNHLCFKEEQAITSLISSKSYNEFEAVVS